VTLARSATICSKKTDGYAYTYTYIQWAVLYWAQAHPCGPDACSAAPICRCDGRACLRIHATTGFLPHIHRLWLATIPLRPGGRSGSTPTRRTSGLSCGCRRRCRTRGQAPRRAGWIRSRSRRPRRLTRRGRGSLCGHTATTRRPLRTPWTRYACHAIGGYQTPRHTGSRRQVRIDALPNSVYRF
jgi:hypothetical protein